LEEVVISIFRIKQKAKQAELLGFFDPEDGDDMYL
jgi:hypothetical protein